MLNYMFVLKFNKCTFDEWKHEMDEEAEKGWIVHERRHDR